MMKSADKYTSENCYDDFTEEPANIRTGNQIFTLKDKVYRSNVGRTDGVEQGIGGVPVWADEAGNVYVDSSDTHTLVIGATGSKKTRLVVMPTVRLMGWAGENIIISDPKAEIYTRTAGELEKQGYRIVVLNFRNPSAGDAWNPLFIPYHFYKQGDIDRACEMINDMARNIILPKEKATDPFWTNSAADLFFGLVLTLFKVCVEKKQSDMAINFGNVIQIKRELFDGENPSKSVLWEYVRNDEVIASALSGVVLTAQDTRGGIISTFDQCVRFFTLQPNLMDMLANHTLFLDEIYDQKTAIYLILPDEKTTYHSLVSLFIKQSYEYLIFLSHNRKGGQMPIRINYILDEFSALPTIKDFPAMITAARSRNIRFCLIVQSKHQLKQRYQEETETIQSNCGNWIFLTSREISLLEEISKLCGRVNKGQLPLISIFDLQHLDKIRGEALMLCGRKRPYFAFLPDIDVYDGKTYLLREIGSCFDRKERQQIRISELINPIVVKDIEINL